MTFPHCHQLYGGFIKYRLGVILVLTYLKAHSVGSVEVVGKTPGGGGMLGWILQDKGRKISQTMTLMRGSLAGHS